MEISELKYFLSVAQTQSVTKAALSLGVSAGSLSKAISKLEEELQTPLFRKSGRGIQLTPRGQELKQRASELLELELDIKRSFAGADQHKVSLQVSCDEILQSCISQAFLEFVEQTMPGTRIQFLIRSQQKVSQQVLSSEVHLGFVTEEPDEKLISKPIGQLDFSFCCSANHPLAGKSEKGSLEIKDLSEFAFASLDQVSMGTSGIHSSLRGFNHEEFGLKVQYQACTLRPLEMILNSGKAFSVLPTFLISKSNFVNLTVRDFHLSSIPIFAICKDPTSYGWFLRLWDRLESL